MIPGKSFKVVGIRDGKKMVWSTTSAPREPAFAKEKELKTWGLTVRDFTLMSSLEARRSDKEGAQVHSVNRGGPSASAKPRLYPGDVIVKVGNRRIRSVKDLLRITHEITRGKNEPIPTLITLERDLAHLLTVVSIGPEAEENQPLQAWKPWLGISTQVLTKDLSQALELPRTTKGIRIIQVFPETPAEKAGLQAGDLLFRIDGQIIMAYRTEDIEVFGNMVKEYKTDATIRLTGFRSGSPLDLNVTLDKRPPPANELPKYEEETFEFTVRELSFSDRVLARLEKDQSGLSVDNVESAGWAALAGLMQGDLLLEIEGIAINQVNEFEKQMNDITRKKPKQIVFFVRRGIHTLFLELEPDWDNE
jgi:serine protease Do